MPAQFLEAKYFMNSGNFIAMQCGFPATHEIVVCASQFTDTIIEI